MPTHPRASTKVRTSPVDTGTPTRRSVAANAVAMRSTGTGDRRVHQTGEPLGAHPLLVLAVLQHRPQRGLDPPLGELGLPEGGERLRPVDDLGDAGRLEQLEATHPLDGAGYLTGEAL